MFWVARVRLRAEEALNADGGKQNFDEAGTAGCLCNIALKLGNSKCFRASFVAMRIGLPLFLSFACVLAVPHKYPRPLVIWHGLGSCVQHSL